MDYKEKKQFSEIYDKYASDIFRYVVLKVDSKSLAEDITAEVFFKTWQFVLNDKKKIDEIRPFLYKIAHNQIIDFYRKKKKKEILLDDLNENESAESFLEKLYVKNSVIYDGVREYIKKDDIRQIKVLIDKLGDKNKEILLLYFLDEFDYKEIAKITGRTSVGVRVAMHRAIKKLKELLKV